MWNKVSSCWLTLASWAAFCFFYTAPWTPTNPLKCVGCCAHVCVCRKITCECGRTVKTFWFSISTNYFDSTISFAFIHYTQFKLHSMLANPYDIWPQHPNFFYYTRHRLRHVRTENIIHPIAFLYKVLIISFLLYLL